MLVNINLSQCHQWSSRGTRLAALLPILLLLTSCANTAPGLDRVLFSNSSAKVGPIVEADETASTATQNNTDSLRMTESKRDSVDQEAKPAERAAVIKQPTQMSPESQDMVKAETSGAETPKPAASYKAEAPQTAEASQRAEAPQPAEAPTKIAKVALEYGAVVGKVVLLGEQKQQIPVSGTMITLTPQTMMDDEQERPAQVHIIDMEDKTYKPRYSTIHAGDQVVFVNKDNIQHNVFSSSGNNAFDLGTYGAGLKRAVTLEEPGIVKIYCNIHSEMATFVAVGDEGLSARVNDEGEYQINDVLPGVYEVTIWNIRGETKRLIEVTANETLNLVDRIDTTAFKVEPHKNKFGGDYSKNSKLFEDEFY